MRVTYHVFSGHEKTKPRKEKERNLQAKSKVRTITERLQKNYQRNVAEDLRCEHSEIRRVTRRV